MSMSNILEILKSIFLWLDWWKFFIFTQKFVYGSQTDLEGIISYCVSHFIAAKIFLRYLELYSNYLRKHDFVAKKSIFQT